MNRFSVRGIFLSVALLFSVVLLTSNVYGEKVFITGVSLEETSILELTNDSIEEVNTLRIWLGTDFNFKSFKTEKGWTGNKNPQGIIIFTSSESIKPGESVKFGVITDKPNAGINWKALDNKDMQISQGKSILQDLPSVDETKNLDNIEQSMSTESVFKIIPEKPNVGSTIRVTGEGFGVSQEFDFYIDTEKIGNFETDNNGHFMTTMKIPDTQKADRAEFIVKNQKGEERQISLRIGENDDRLAPSSNIPLTIKGIPNTVHRGDFLEIFGTGDPNGAITAEITTPEGKIINSRTAEIDNKGDWKLNESVIIPLDTPFGKYSATISDGRDKETLSWTVVSDKKIIIVPTSLKFEKGETMKFNGTALPNTPIELILEDPLGKEIVSDIIQIDQSGDVGFAFPTSQNTIEGTYTLIATQGKDTEFIYAGVGQLPSIPVKFEFDKLSYKAGETAIISLAGKPSEIVSLLIIDPSEKPKGSAVSIKLQQDGRGTHFITLDRYSSGVYTAIISQGTAQSEEVFTVGLTVGAGSINIKTVKEDYHPGDPILILGDTNNRENVLLTITMTNPNGDVIKIKDTFSDKDGKISEASFRIPSDAVPGTWMINARSGSDFGVTNLDVHATKIEGMVVSVVDGLDVPGIGKSINILVFGAQHTVKFEIIAEDGEIITKLAFPASNQGEIHQPWIIPKDTEPGTYTVRASEDNFKNSVETTFEIQ